MYKTFYEQYQAQTSLQTTIAQKWGYHFHEKLSQKKFKTHHSTHSDQKSTSFYIKNNSRNKYNRQPPKILSSIRPYADRQKQLPYNQQIQKLNLELQIMKSQRQRNKNPSKENFQVMAMLQQRINQYNYLLEHKHLTEIDSLETRKIMKIQPKTQAELILQKINEKKDQLLNGKNDISKQYLINKNMNTLYKKFKDNMFKTVKRGNITSLTKNQNSKPNLKDSLQKTVITGKPKNCQMSKSLANPLRQNKNHRSQSVQMINDLQSPIFINKKYNMIHSMIQPHQVRQRQQKQIKSFINSRNLNIKANRKTSKPLSNAKSSSNRSHIDQIKNQIFGKNKIFQKQKSKEEDSQMEGHSSIVQCQEVQNTSQNIKSGSRYQNSSLANKSIGQISVKNQKYNSNKKHFKEQQNIDCPFIEKKYIQKGIQMDKKIKNSQDVIDLWRVRISDSRGQMQKIKSFRASRRKHKNLFHKSFQNQLLNSPDLIIHDNQAQNSNQKYISFNLAQVSEIKKRSQLKNPQENETNQIYDQNENQINNFSQVASKLRQKKLNQKKLLSSYLQKRNTKFMKPYGNKILIKYDSINQASSMIDGSNRKQDDHLKQMEMQAQTSLSMLKRSSMKNAQNEKNSERKKSDLEQLLIPSKKVLELDQDYYWTMIKNQKINLLLKSSKH